MKRGILVFTCLFSVCLISFVIATISSSNINLISPISGGYSNSSTPVFSFNVSSDYNETFLCELMLNHRNYGINNSVLNNTATTITANETILDGEYDWYINCTDSNESAASSTRQIRIDTDAPTFSDNSTSSTEAGTLVWHNLKWAADWALSGYILGFDNCTGAFVNDPFVSFSGATNWSNVSKIINSSVGCMIRWQVYANDSAGNWNLSGIYSYVTTDTIGPAITLNAPVAYANLSSTNVTFNCSAEDPGGLANISLYGNFTGSWGLNETQSNFGTSNLSVFYVKMTTDKAYKWSCQACDNSGNCNFSSNRTFKIDTDDPVVMLISPDDGHEYTITSGKQSVTFTYNVTDNFDIKNCSLYTENRLNTTDTSVDKEDDQTITFSLPGGNWDWKIRCFDYSGNDAYSVDEWRVTVTVSSDDSSGGSGDCTSNEKRCYSNFLQICDSGSWGTIQNCSYGCNSTTLVCKPAPTSTLNSSNNNSNTIKLSSGAYNLSLNGQANFTINGTNHTIIVENITNSSVTVELRSNPIIAVFGVNETKTFDMNGNGKKDVSIRLISIVNQKADFSINELSEPADVQKKPLLNFNWFKWNIDWKRIWPFLAVVVIAVAAFVVGMVLEKRRLKGQYWRKGKKIALK